MRYWFVAFSIALVVVLGHAVGPLGLLIAILAFGVALFLLWADQLGIGGAWEAFGFDRFEAPVSAPANWDRLAPLLQDRGKVAKALTLTLALTALSLILPEESVLIGVIVAIGWSIRKSLTRRPASSAATATRPQASLSSPTRFALDEPFKISLNAPVDAVASQPVQPAILLTPAVASDARPASSTATISFMIRGKMSSASSLALLARGRYRKQRVNPSPKRPKRTSKSRTSRKPTRHVPLHLKLPLGRRQIRRPKRPLQAGPKLPSRRTSKN